jgi:hypothetical protein
MDRPRNSKVKVHCMGSLAMHLFSIGRIATVFGINDRGLFLKFDNDRMIFLSFEKYRGPLTVNLKGDIHLLSNCSPGETAFVSRDEMLFSDLAIRIPTSPAKIWTPPLPTGIPLSTDERIHLIRKFALDAYRQKNKVELSELLRDLTGYHSGITHRDGNSGTLEKILTKSGIISTLVIKHHRSRLSNHSLDWAVD